MKFIENKQELSKFCHLSDFIVSPIGDSTHVKMLISFICTASSFLDIIIIFSTVITVYQTAVDKSSEVCLKL